jgi:hypothetical protein
MTFADFIMAQPRTDTVRGDFVADAKDEIRRGDFPQVETWDQLSFYLTFRKRACPEAIKAGKAVFKAWKGSINGPDAA